MLVDTHTHLYLPVFEDTPGGGADAVRRAIDAGIRHMIFPNVGIDTITPMKRLAAEFPGSISMAMGLHPTEVGENWQEDTTKALSEFDNADYCALGEVGIDLYWDRTYERQQMLSLERQLTFAAERSLPVIIHCREGLPQCLEVLSQFPSLTAVFHSFGGTVEDVETIRRHGDHYFGINGIVTFKNCHVRDTLPAIGLDRLVLETDSPYLAPVPHRGKRNESAYLIHTATHIAASLGTTLDEVATRTTASASRLFALNCDFLS